MSESSSSSSSGIGLLGATFLVFLVLKLTGYIDWSWWWVTAPIWGVASLLVLVLVSIGTVLCAGTLMGKVMRRRDRPSTTKKM